MKYPLFRSALGRSAVIFATLSAAAISSQAAGENLQSVTYRASHCVAANEVRNLPGMDDYNEVTFALDDFELRLTTDLDDPLRLTRWKVDGTPGELRLTVRARADSSVVSGPMRVPAWDGWMRGTPNWLGVRSRWYVGPSETEAQYTTENVPPGRGDLDIVVRGTSDEATGSDRPTVYIEFTKVDHNSSRTIYIPFSCDFQPL
jgi:hypothetical protein